MFGMFYKYKNHLELCTVHKHVLALATDARWNTCKTTEKEWQRYRCIYASMVWFGTVWCAMPALSVTTTALNSVCMLAIVICASATNKNSSNGSDVQPTQELSLYLGDIHRFWCICWVRVSSIFVRHFVFVLPFWFLRLFFCCLEFSWVHLK